MGSPVTLDAARDLVRNGDWFVLTGAGMSVDSGVPPFRGPGGLWERMDPERYAHVETLESAPERAWELFRLLGRSLSGAAPHAGHRALAAAEAAGRVCGIATQNIDGLHQLGGSVTVIELHGSMRTFSCHACRRTAPAPAFDDGPVPRCAACRGVLRPDITLYGEMLPDGAFERAERLLRLAHGLLVVGTSSEVYPAAILPRLGLERRMPLLVVGPDPSVLTGMPGVAWLAGRAGDVLPALLAMDSKPESEDAP